MAKPPQRLHPWGHRGCDPQSLLEFVSATLRDDHARVQAWLERPISIAEYIEVLIRRHRLGAFLFSRMHGRECWELLPLESRQRLTQSKTAQDLIARQSLDTLETVREQLASRGIPFVVLKGVEIATRFYGATAARGYRDIDLLISERDRDATLDCLQTAGWHRLSRIFLSTQFASKYQHAFDYRKGDALLDLHWALTRLPGLAISTEEVMSRAQSQRLADSNYQVLDQVDELVLLLISAFADIQRGALRLQSFVDIALVSQKLSPLDWDRYHDQVNKSHGNDILDLDLNDDDEELDLDA
ncbi:MAG: nucleotidyltransferase family protein [Planctomycetota bacterium]